MLHIFEAFFTVVGYKWVISQYISVHNNVPSYHTNKKYNCSILLYKKANKHILFTVAAMYHSMWLRSDSGYFHNDSLLCFITR